MSELEKILLENRRMRRALEYIEAWDIPKVHDKKLGRMVSFGYAHGTNGERDHMRGIASRALKTSLTGD